MSVATTEQVRIERSPKRVRAYLGGVVVADSTDTRLVWERPWYPVFFFPRADVRAELVESGRVDDAPLGRAHAHHVKAGAAVAEHAAWRYVDHDDAELRGLVRIDWPAMDHWFEEDEEVFVHARNPHTRVDILPTSRHVVVRVDGTVVAESRRAHALFETGLPTRWYLPLLDVRLDLLRPSDTSSQCPYKGTASYWSVAVGDRVVRDAAWTYPTPLPESARVAGLVAFYDDRVDIEVDGEPVVPVRRH